MADTPPLMQPERAFYSSLRGFLDEPAPEDALKLNKGKRDSGSGPSRGIWRTSGSSLSSTFNGAGGRGEGRGEGKGDGVAMKKLKKTPKSPYKSTPFTPNSAHPPKSASDSTRNLLTANSNSDMRLGSSSGFSSVNNSRSNVGHYSASNPSASASTVTSPLATYSTNPSAPTSVYSSRPSSPVLGHGVESFQEDGGKGSGGVVVEGEERGGGSKREFELTPLSGLLTQSRRDIEMLKVVHGRGSGSGNLPSPSVSGAGVAAGAGLEAAARKISDGMEDIELNDIKTTSNGTGNGNGNGKGRDDCASAIATVTTTTVNSSEEESRGGRSNNQATPADFDQVSEDLKMFEDMYRAFLQTPTPTGRPRTEIHLLAMVCKRSEVVRGC
ncbi:hypothetical protein VTL71DRAFT_4422 [Oculimacula yallundae]|uniref:Uncharacterized protein n=1 Tax=Oculimacula yallundae TaxID=86028 RepID=A0ABR4C1W3_9HELO